MIKMNVEKISVKSITTGQLNIGRNIVLGAQPMKLPIVEPPVTPAPR